MGSIKTKEVIFREYNESVRLTFEVWRRNSKYSAEWEKYRASSKKEKFALAHAIFRTFGMLHDPAKPIPQRRIHVFAITEKHLRKGTSLFQYQTPVAICDNGIWKPYEAVEEDVEIIIRRLKSLSAEMREKEKGPIANRFGSNGLYIPTRINFWAPVEHERYFSQKVISAFKKIFAREHDLAREIPYYEVGLEAFDLSQKGMTDKQILRSNKTNRKFKVLSLTEIKPDTDSEISGIERIGQQRRKITELVKAPPAFPITPPA